MDLVLILLLIAPHMYATEYSLGGKVFIQYYDQMSWRDAQAYCRQHHTDLVTIQDATENLYLYRNAFYGWIGMYRVNSTSQWQWSSGDQVSYSLLSSSISGNCLYKNSLYWSTMNCGELHTFICYYLPLVLVNEEKTWEEALTYCRSMGVNDPTVYNNHSHDLASIITQDNYTLAQQMIQQATTQQVWTGLRFLGDQWMWVGGENVQDTRINTCPDIDRCGTVDKTSKAGYGLKECKNKYNFFCYKNPSSRDLKGPLVLR